LEPLEEALHDGGGADFQRLEGGVVEGPVPSNRDTGITGVGLLGGWSAERQGNKSGQKIRARLACEAPQASPDFLAGQGAWTERRGGRD
jgi:hypothetical protein